VVERMWQQLLHNKHLKNTLLQVEVKTNDSPILEGPHRVKNEFFRRVFFKVVNGTFLEDI
jgi:hypothetical protein